MRKLVPFGMSPFLCQYLPHVSVAAHYPERQVGIARRNGLLHSFRDSIKKLKGCLNRELGGGSKCCVQRNCIAAI